MKTGKLWIGVGALGAALAWGCERPQQEGTGGGGIAEQVGQAGEKAGEKTKEAYEKAESAVERAQSEQQQAGQAQQGQQPQQEGGGAMGGGGAEGQQKQLHGELQRAAGSSIVVETDQQGTMTLYFDPDTTVVTIDGQQGTVDQLQEGSDIRASYSIVNDRPTATQIQASSGTGQQQQQKQPQKQPQKQRQQ